MTETKTCTSARAGLLRKLGEDAAALCETTTSATKAVEMLTLLYGDKDGISEKTIAGKTYERITWIDTLANG